MNKKTILTALLALITVTGQAQVIKTGYENITDSLPTAMQEYLEMQRVEHFRVTLTGNFDGKRAKIKKVTCDNAGAFTERTLMSEYIHLVFTDSIETVDFMAVPYGNDSLRINCFYIEGDGGRVRLFADTLKSDWRKILLETLTPGNGPDYPIMAYSSGIPIPGGAYWFCGLRESGTEPRLWYEKHGIKDYVYYTVTLEDDTPVSEKDDFYVKVSKGDYYGLHR